MKNKSKGIRIIIVVAISLSSLTSSAYFCYYTVAAADFLSTGLNYETFDHEFLSAAFENELKPDSFLKGLLINYYLELPHYFSPKMPSFDQDTFVLRC